MSKFFINKKLPYIDVTYDNFMLTEKIAAFDLDFTLVEPKSGAKFPKDENDWKLSYDNIKNKLNELYKSGFCVIIFSNQKGLSSGKFSSPDVWIKKIKLIGEHLKIPFRCFASIDSDIYRKPFPTLFNNLTKNININSLSFFCGDAAGRKNDFSDTDRKFAVNCGLKFKVPEELFNNETVVLPAINYGVDFTTLNKNASKTTFKPANKEMIIMVGFPGSGKSSFVQNTLIDNGYKRINMDSLKTKAKCVKECERQLADNKNVVIDNTNPSTETRKIYIDLAKKYKFSVRVVKIDCPLEVAIHNTYYRSFINNGDIGHIPMVVYHKYKKVYEEPNNNEGIKEIITVQYQTPVDAKYNYYFY